jgi:transmembrane sensor
MRQMSQHQPMPEEGESAGELTPLEEEAHAWVRRLASGEVTRRDAQALKSWCDTSTAHAAAFSEASQFWQALGPAARALRDDLAVTGDRRPERRPLRIGRRAVLGGALAASAAALMIARPPLGLWPAFSELQADYRTGIGEQRRIAVNDDVAVQMNGRTSISIGAGSDLDMINLIAGEASFATADRLRPFRVVAAAGSASAVNARFDMRVLGSTARVTCFADGVRVVHGGDAVTLAPRQRVSYDDHGLGPIVAIDPVAAAAWQDGLMIFDMTPLAEVIDELNRYRSGRIVLLNSDVAQAPVNGRFRIDRPQEALAQIERAFGLRQRLLPGGLALLS